MKVYTYFDIVPELNQNEQYLMHDVWYDSWIKHGWEPIILNINDAKFYINWERFKEKCSMFPTVNPAAYEFACFARWAAMLTVNGGLMVDYDVVNNGFAIDMLPNLESDLPIALTDIPCPCAMYGNTKQFENFVDMLENYKIQQSDMHGQRAHVSDQSIMAANIDKFSYTNQCLPFGNKWSNSLLVHVSHQSCAEVGANRVQAMRSIK